MGFGNTSNVSITGGTLNVGNEVEVKNDSGNPVPVSAADGSQATIGAKADTAITDSTASATMVALLKGLIKQLQGNGAGTLPVKLSDATIQVPVQLANVTMDDGTAGLPILIVDPTTPTQKLKVNTDGSINGTMVSSTIPDTQPIPVKQVTSNVISPVNMSFHESVTIQTHTGATVGISGTSLGNYSSSWIDTLGYNSVSVTMLNDASTTSYADIQWSHDGSTYHSADFGGIPSNTASKKGVTMAPKSRYMRVSLGNSDGAAPHTMSAWAYLQA